MESDETYNGWTNRETWALNLWIGNDEGLYLAGQEFAETLDADDARRDDKVREWFSEDIVPLLQETEIGRGALEDIGSLWRVNWTETADALLEK